MPDDVCTVYRFRHLIAKRLRDTKGYDVSIFHDLRGFRPIRTFDVSSCWLPMQEIVLTPWIVLLIKTEITNLMDRLEDGT